MAAQSTIKVLEYLKAQTEPKTHKQIQADLGFDKVASVVGATTSFAKKGYVVKIDVPVEKDGKQTTEKAIQITELGLQTVLTEDAPKTAEISDKAKEVLNFLQKDINGNYTAADIADNFGVQPIAINGVVNGLIKKGLALREAQEIAMPDGTTKTIKYVKLTDEGIAKAL